ncbi:Obtusifoliol 14-alpha demethylase [Hordeum vulgare]|uniref:obtusifoliol 14-alpha demethylase-like n=1 Tax=Hordeum vulgare subsp. vulgare TaxID=112509 RepID=UPI001B8517E6|nr:obtusifoliol 14-alpha demethylase-like [Hordeum vulgare subsp. vulgare]KAE8792444.1 Obtusifoliol 14-alpha demethylase [Hordeum vulgare]
MDMDQDTIHTAACFTIAFVFLTIIISKIIARVRTIHPMRKGQRSAVTRPPPHVVSGAPLMAALLTLLTPMKGLHAAIHDLHMKMGSVFTVNLFGLKKVTFLVGPEVNAHFFKGSPSEIDFGDTAKVIVPVLGPGVLFGVDLATRNEQIRFCTKAIQPARLRRDVPSMVSEVEDYFVNWGPNGTVDLKDELGHLMVLIANRCLLGNEIKGKNLQEVSRLLHELFENSFHMINLFFPHLPIPQHRRRGEARGRLGEILHEIVRSRRRITPARFADDGGDDEGDVLQYFIDSKYSNGRSMTDSEIVGLLIAILFAGQHTSSSTSTWTGACLLSHQKYMAAAREEQKQIIEQNGEPIDYITLSKMGTLRCCIKEALRLYSPTPILLRHAHKSFTVQTRDGMEFEIPEGHDLACSVAVSNKLPYIYKNPNMYDPYRFSLGREEDKTGGKLSDISFGAGRYSCLGQDYAFMQIKVIWSYLLRNFELELISPFPELENDKILPGPRGKVMVTYTRRSIVN